MYKIPPQSVKNLYSSSIISGEDKRPNIIIVERDTVYIFELTIGFETNISTNSETTHNC